VCQAAPDRSHSGAIAGRRSRDAGQEIVECRFLSMPINIRITLLYFIWSPPFTGVFLEFRKHMAVCKMKVLFGPIFFPPAVVCFVSVFSPDTSKGPSAHNFLSMSVLFWICCSSFRAGQIGYEGFHAVFSLHKSIGGCVGYGISYIINRM